MKRTLSIAALLLLACTLLFAQEGTITTDESITTEESEESEVTFDYHVLQQGDGYINLNLALSLPIRPIPNLKIGGGVAIGYTYMMLDTLSVGGEACFSYNATIGNNVLYFIPILATVGYHPTFGNVELSCLRTATGCAGTVPSSDLHSQLQTAYSILYACVSVLTGAEKAVLSM